MSTPIQSAVVNRTLPTFTRLPRQAVGAADAPLHDFPVRDEVLYQFLNWSPDLHLLEIGPGSGFTAYWLSRQIRSMTLLDIASQTIEDLRTQFREMDNLSFIIDDACTLGLADRLPGRFGAIISLDVLDLIPDPRSMFRNLAESLEIGGQLLVSFPNLSPPYLKGPTFFQTRTEIDCILGDAGFDRWEVLKIRFHPWARFWYSVLHELPIRLFRSIRIEQDRKHLVYQTTWAFRNRQRLTRYKRILDSYWRLVGSILRKHGDVFVWEPAKDPILNSQLLIQAWK